MSLTGRPSVGEAPFEPQELFFSRTDERGVIQAANSVFQRVSNYPWDDLIGAPQKLIRHPDMPRAIFWLLWQSISDGRPIGAYVKNKARDGLHYWVFATVTPIEGGYLSIRIKPSHKILPQIEAEYATLRSQELTEDLSPSESATILLKQLKNLGFSSYEAFMAHALCIELREHDQLADRLPHPQMRPLRRALENVTTLQDHATILYKNLCSLKCTPVNMRLTASRVEGSGGPVGLMAHNYATVLKEVEEWLARFLDETHGDLAKIANSTFTAAFDFASSQVQTLANEQFFAETQSETSTETEAEKELLAEQARVSETRSYHSLAMVQRRASALESTIRDMRRGCAGLNATRMMCKAEAARLNGAGGLDAIVHMLDKVQTETEIEASKILDASMRLLAEIETIQSFEEINKPTREARMPPLQDAC